jgi:hypothetical protein
MQRCKRCGAPVIEHRIYGNPHAVDKRCMNGHMVDALPTFPVKKESDKKQEKKPRQIIDF